MHACMHAAGIGRLMAHPAEIILSKAIMDGWITTHRLWWCVVTVRVRCRQQLVRAFPSKRTKRGGPEKKGHAAAAADGHTVSDRGQPAVPMQVAK